MVRGWYRIRELGWSALCALALMCVCAAGQSTDAATKPAPSTTKSTTAKKPASVQHHSSSNSSPSKPATSATHTASSHASSTGKRSSRKKTSRVRGQQKIDSERATAIQQALIREHYLSGQPAGTWNQSSEEAMRRYQADHGWQAKEVPDSRALIKLGLGPSKDHLLNPESAMTSAPDAPHASVVPPPAPRSPAADPAPATHPDNSSSPQ